MTLQSLMVHDITIQASTATVDIYGNTLDSWTTPTATTVKGWVSQRDNGEDTTDRDQQTRIWQAFLPADTAITGHDRVLWGTLTFEVVGPPNRAWTPRGEHHIEADLRLIEG